jgi:SAM-dependent methyltransferase
MSSFASSKIRRELLSLLVCPETGLPLSGWDGASRYGTLTTIEGKTYPIRQGIPCLLPTFLQEATAPLVSDASELAEKKREMDARDAQAEDYDRMLGLRIFTAVELPLSLRYLWLEPQHLMLEGGCGTGRMTAAFSQKVRGLVCADFSFASILAARQKLSPELAEKTLFIQADLSQLPLRSDSFDRVGSFGVYEHIPTPDARSRALTEMGRVLKPRTEGGRIALSAYRWGAPINWTSEREGHHEGGIYFRRFTMDELKHLFAVNFCIGESTEKLLYYHLLWGRKP